MKTAVSLPDELFHRAEATAQRLRVTRSELYAKALGEFLKQQDDDAITDRLNEVYSRHSSELDPGLQRGQLASLDREDW